MAIYDNVHVWKRQTNYWNISLSNNESGACDQKMRSSNQCNFAGAPLPPINTHSSIHGMGNYMIGHSMSSLIGLLRLLIILWSNKK